jgi:hypothetical protein
VLWVDGTETSNAAGLPLARAPRARLTAPSRPTYLTGVADLGALRAAPAPAILGALAPALPMPAWADEQAALDFSVFPNPQGPAAGLLSETLLVLRTPGPDDARSTLQHAVDRLAQVDGPWSFDATWSESAGEPPIEGASAFDISVRTWPPDASPMQRMLFGSLLGRMGLRGAVAPGAAVQALLDMPLVGELLEQIRQSTPEFLGVPAPRFEPGLPPVAVAVDPRDGAIVATVVVPAPVLAPLLDEARRR